jgi:hypothetical protein
MSALLKSGHWGAPWHVRVPPIPDLKRNRNLNELAKCVRRGRRAFIVCTAASGLPIPIPSTFSPTNASANATANAVAAVVAADEITKDTITFGNGNGDYVALSGLSAVADSGPTTGAYALATDTAFTSSASVAEVSADGAGEVSNNTITFGQGNGDYVNIAGDLSDNTITFGNGTGVSVTASSSSNNKITMGNGNNDAVTLGCGAGGDIIITGTGNSDTVQVGAHPITNPDSFGFALGTGTTALSQTTVKGAQAGDQIAVGNSSGLVLTNNGLGGNFLQKDGFVAGLSTVNDFITYLDTHGLTKGDTYTADSGGNTFIVTDTASGKIGGIEIVGIFEGSTLSGIYLRSPSSVPGGRAYGRLALEFGDAPRNVRTGVIGGHWAAPPRCPLPSLAV